jgi:hypothetical protein
LLHRRLDDPFGGLKTIAQKLIDKVCDLVYVRPSRIIKRREIDFQNGFPIEVYEKLENKASCYNDSSGYDKKKSNICHALTSKDQLRRRTIGASISKLRLDGWVLCRVANVLYFFLLFASALAKFSLTLNFTIRLIKSKGIGLSSGNLTVPFPPS